VFVVPVGAFGIAVVGGLCGVVTEFFGAGASVWKLSQARPRTRLVAKRGRRIMRVRALHSIADPPTMTSSLNSGYLDEVMAEVYENRRLAG
jgi:hypothetical protein